jgi:hypothetical protein
MIRETCSESLCILVDRWFLTTNPHLAALLWANLGYFQVRLGATARFRGICDQYVRFDSSFPSIVHLDLCYDRWYEDEGEQGNKGTREQGNKGIGTIGRLDSTRFLLHLFGSWFELIITWEKQDWHVQAVSNHRMGWTMLRGGIKG